MDAHQTSIFVAVLITCVVVVVIIAYFTVTLIRHHRRNVALYKAKIMAEITTLENERKRIASDLHDELGPILAGIKLKLHSLEVPDEEDKITLERVHENISEMIGRMRTISNDLMPVILMKKGLITAMEVTIDEINSAKGMKVELIYERIPELSEQVSINLYRILQEIVHNTIKHAGASMLTIEFRQEKRTLLLTTRDNGSGFNYPAEAKELAGQGLQNLLTRTDVLGGNMYVDSAPGKGTTYTFDIPI